MKNKFTLFVIFILAINTALYSQKKKRGSEAGSDTKYTVLTENESFNIIGGAFGIDGAGSSFNSNLGINTGLIGRVGKFDFKAFYNRQTSGLAESSSSSSDAKSIYEYKASQFYDLRAGFEVASSTENIDLPVFYKVSGSTIYYLKVPVKQKISYLAEGGLNKGVTFFSSEKSEFNGVADGASYVEDFSSRRVETYMSYTVLNFGISQVKSARAKIQIKNGEESSDFHLKKLYGRISIMINHEFDDILVPGTYDSYTGETSYFLYKLHDHTEITKMGLNIGYFSFMHNSYWFAEGGFAPGPKGGIGTRFYLGAGFGIMFSKKFD